MNSDEKQFRNQGYMATVGLLLKHSDRPARDAILNTLRSFGDGLADELDLEEYQMLAADDAPQPCPPGYYWDPMLKRCMPIEDPAE
jgi:hypothetical protein